MVCWQTPVISGVITWYGRASISLYLSCKLYLFLHHLSSLYLYLLPPACLYPYHYNITLSFMVFGSELILNTQAPWTTDNWVRMTAGRHETAGWIQKVYACKLQNIWAPGSSHPVYEGHKMATIRVTLLQHTKCHIFWSQKSHCLGYIYVYYIYIFSNSWPTIDHTEQRKWAKKEASDRAQLLCQHNVHSFSL